MSSGRDEWMSNWSEEDKQRNLQSYLGQIPEEFGGVTGKQYEQLEFDFMSMSDEQLDKSTAESRYNILRTKEEATNLILQAKAIIGMVMDNIGEGGRDFDKQEFSLWGASELLDKAASVLE